jgi:ribonucleoside-diphosphate reductase alpha chain
LSISQGDRRAEDQDSIMTEQEYQTEVTQRPVRRRGLTVNRKFTAGGLDPYSSVSWSKRTSRIANPDGTVVFEMADAEIPATWSQVAADIMVSKYFRKAGVPQYDDAGQPIRDEHGTQTTGPERSARQVIHRLAGCWRYWGEKYGYFNSVEDAQAFYDELAYMLVNQMAAPNSPQWFNTGLNYAYGITGPAQGHYYVDDATGEVRLSEDAYTHPQPHACQPYDALISTPAGPVRIGDIVTGDRVGLEVYDGSADGAGTTRVVAVKANGEKSVYRIVLKSGAAIEATPDHLVFVRDESKGTGRWARVDEVQAGQRMLVSTRTRVAAESEPLAVAEAALAGWLQGDGFVGQYETGTNRSLTLEFMTINDDEMRAVIGWIEQVFPGHHYHIRAVESKSGTIDVRRIRLYGEGLRPFVMKYGLLRNGLDIEVPAAIRESGVEGQRAYLRSLFQADGTVRLRRRASRTADVVLTSVSPALVQGVQTLLLNDGIYSRVSTGVERRENRRTPYQLSIGYADARQRFAETIGFISRDKQEKLAVACSDEFAGKRLPGMREEIVTRVEIKGFEPVFDIQTESGQYLSNNVLVHNCFIQSVADDLVGEGGIMDLWVREARLFKYGSGTGTNFSTLRGEGEPLSGGGTSSGLMSFLRVGDRAAGAIKSGGTTRRAAKMVCLDVDHPDIEAFITWKADEEKKVEALIEAGYPSDYNGDAYATVSGQNANNSVRVTNDFIKAVDEDRDWNLIRRTDRRGRLAERGPGPAVRHHHQRVAHQPGKRPHQRQQPVFRIYVLGQHGLQPGESQFDEVRRSRNRRCRYRGLPPRGPALDDRARDQRADGAVPEPRDRPPLVRLPHTRSRLRQHRHGADDPRPALRLGRGPRLHQCDDRGHDRRVLRDLGRDGARPRTVPGLRGQRAAHAAGDP